MKTRAKALKVKIKSLAAEAGIIRLEERRARRDDRLRCELHEHRVGIVRSEQRHSLLAYAFLRGRSYAAAEPKAAKAPDWTRVAKLVEKFGTTEWAKEAKEAQATAFKEWSAIVRA
jgi:hypothetical protein